MTKPDKTRNLRSPAEKAIAALGVEQRRVEKLQAKRDAHLDAAAALADELTAAMKRRDYLAANPDLPEADTDPIPGGVDVTYKAVDA